MWHEMDGKWYYWCLGVPGKGLWQNGTTPVCMLSDRVGFVYTALNFTA